LGEGEGHTNQPMSLLAEDQDRFVMLHQTQDLDSLFAALARKDLQPMDATVFLALMRHMDRVGRARISTTAIAETLGFSASACSRSLGRLRRQCLIAKVYDRTVGETYFLLNPYVASVGGSQRRGHLWAQFKAALED
jgi:hypothetical protein